LFFFFFFNDTATTEIYTLSLHDALPILAKLNNLDYYNQPYPKSLANDFGTDIVYPMIQQSGVELKDCLRTYVAHIVAQIKNALEKDLLKLTGTQVSKKMLVTGGGAFNDFLMQRLSEELKTLHVDVIVPDADLIKYKEALIIAFMGVLRWRQEYNVLSSVTGASRDSIGGALWIGQEA